ncbi:MAG: cytochrome C oxidase subunit IV family protein [Lentisphaerae bacterium]|nr:cytochrome C oxidase subunit IV family protein [Lentisphaerota bacterium]
MKHHIVPVRLYLGIFGALMVLTAITVTVSFYDLGFLNTFVAITIAVCKATLVILYFMHVRYSNKLIWVFAGAGFVWLVILIAFTLSDTMTRAWIPLPPPLPM